MVEEAVTTHREESSFKDRDSSEDEKKTVEEPVNTSLDDMDREEEGGERAR